MEATDQARADEIGAARGDAGELLDIFAALLRIAEIEGMSERLPRSEFDLSALMEQMAETYRPDAEASDHHLLTEIAPGVRICLAGSSPMSARRRCSHRDGTDGASPAFAASHDPELRKYKVLL